MPNADVFDNNVARVAIVKSWDQEFLGPIGTLVHDILQQYIWEPDVYARIVHHVQSSGTGKSRVHDELAKLRSCRLF